MYRGSFVERDGIAQDCRRGSGSRGRIGFGGLQECRTRVGAAPDASGSNRRMSLNVVSSHEPRGTALRPRSNPCLAWGSFTDTRPHCQPQAHPHARRPNPSLSQTLRRQGLGCVLARDESHLSRGRVAGGRAMGCLPARPVHSSCPAVPRDGAGLALAGVRLGMKVIRRRRAPEVTL